LSPPAREHWCLGWSTDGKTPYFHQAWADSKDGKVNFSTTDPTNRGYLGTYSDFTQADSTDPTKYFWVELVGNLQVGGRNYIINSSGFGASNTNRASVKPNYTTSAFSNSAISYNNDSITLTYTGTGTQEWFYAVAEAFRTYDSVGLDKTKQYTISVEAMGTAPGAAFRINDVLSPSVSLSNEKWTKLKYTFKFPDIGEKFYIRLNAFAESYIGNFVQGQTLSFRNFKLEEGNVATDWSPAPEDTQEQFKQTNDALIALNDVFDKTVVPVASITAPPSPKEGQGWWVLNSSQQMIGFKIYKNGAWTDSPIQQSAMNIGTLNGNIINGATINTSDFNMSFDQTNTKGGVNKKGTTTIENGEIRTDFQIKNTTQTGYVHLTPEGLSTGNTNPDGTEQNSVSLAFGQIDLSTTVRTPSGGKKLVQGSLNAEDMEKSRTTYWESGGAGDRQKFWAYKQFRRVVLTGIIVLPAANFGTGGSGYRTIFNITDTSLRPLTTRWVKCSSFGDIPHLGLLEFRPNGDVVAIGIPSQGRYSFEGESYAIENL